MSEKLSVEARAVMDLTSRENATYLDVLAAVTRMEAAAEERGRRAGIQAVVVHLITRQWRARLRTDKDVFEEVDNLVAEIRALTPESPVDIAPRDSGPSKPESDADFIGRIEKGFRK